MAANTKAIYPGSVNSGSAKFETADGTDLKDVFTAGSEGSRIDSLVATSNDGTPRKVTLYINDGVNDIPFGTTTIPANAGRDGVEAAKNLLDPVMMPQFDLASGNDPSKFLKTNHKLRAGLDGAVTADKEIWLLAAGGNY